MINQIHFAMHYDLSMLVSWQQIKLAFKGVYWWKFGGACGRYLSNNTWLNHVTVMKDSYRYIKGFSFTLCLGQCAIWEVHFMFRTMCHMRSSYMAIINSFISWDMFECNKAILNTNFTLLFIFWKVVLGSIRFFLKTNMVHLVCIWV